MTQTIKCPYCAEEIKSEAKICKHCQKDLATKEAKNLINIQLNRLKFEQDKKDTENLANKLEEKLTKYPEQLRSKLANNKNFLNKLENMSENEIENDIFKRERNKNLKKLWISSILISFIFPIVYLFTIWLHPKKDEKSLFLNRIKNFKNHKLRVALSIIFLLLFLIFSSASQDVKQQQLAEQQRIEKVNNTTIKAKYDINETFTDKEQININLELNNIKSLIINDKNISFSGTTLEYTHNLKLGENTISIIGVNDDIEKKVTKKIQRVTSEELQKIEQEKIAKIEAEKIAQEEKIKKEIELKEQERIDKIWTYSDSTDEMNGNKTYFAITNSNNTEYFDFPYNGGSTFMLTLRKQGNNTDILFRVSKGQILGNYGGRNVRIKFDDNPPFNISFSEPSSYDSNVIFLGSESKLIQKMKVSKKMKVEVEYYQEGNKIAEFDVEGLKW